MSIYEGEKARPLKKAKVDKKEYDECMNSVWLALETMAKVMANNLAAAENARQASGAGDRIEQLMTFRKLSPPPFKGSSDLLEAADWITRLESIFVAMECSDEDRVVFAVFMLKDAAYDWWRFTRPHAGDDHHLTWKEFVELFNQRYLPETARIEKEEEFLKLVQGSMSVAQYSNKFDELLRFAKHIVPDSYRMARKFEGGLRFDIRSRISPMLLKTYSDVRKRAMIVERFSEEYRRRRRPRVEDNRACFNCGMNDHFVRDCPHQNGRRESVSFDSAGHLDN